MEQQPAKLKLESVDLRGAASEHKSIVKRMHTWEIADPAEARRAHHEMLLKLETMPTLPETAAEREFLGDEVWAELHDGFILEKKLSNTDVELWHSVPKCIPEGDQKTLLEHGEALKSQRAFDFYLIEQFGRWGQRLTVSTQVANRILQWEIHDADMMKRYADSLLNRARVVQNQGGGHLQIRGEDIRKIEQLLLPGLRTLFRKVHMNFGKLQSECTNSGLVVFLEKEIADDPVGYSNLSNYLPNLVAFINSRESRFASKIRDNQIRPEGFLYMLLQLTTRYSRRQLKRLKSRR